MKKCIAEFVGTLLLVLIACGVAALTGCIVPEAGYIATALAFGLTLMGLCYMIGHISGCHVNPAVSIGMAVAGRMEWLECVKYVVAQFLGGIVGALILALCLGGNFDTLGANAFGATLLNGVEVTWWMAMLAEAILTFVFVAVILAVTDKKEFTAISGVVIGLTLTLVHLFGIPVTGTSVNPARSLGPAVFQGGVALEQVWLFIVAPIVGCILAGLFYRFVLVEAKAKK